MQQLLELGWIENKKIPLGAFQGCLIFMLYLTGDHVGEVLSL